MAHAPDIAITYTFSDESQEFETPLGVTAVTFEATIPLWAVGGLDNTVECVPFDPLNVYIPANRLLTVRFDQTLAPWFALKSHVGGTEGFITAIWHDTSEEDQLVHDLLTWVAQQ